MERYTASEEFTPAEAENVTVSWPPPNFSGAGLPLTVAESEPICVAPAPNGWFFAIAYAAALLALTVMVAPT